MDAIKVQILIGTCDAKCSLYCLSGVQLILETIFDLVNAWYQEHIDLKTVSYKDCGDRGTHINGQLHLQFPLRKDININMMPIKLFDESTIPDEAHGYLEFIRQCHVPRYPNLDKIVYLTIHESWVPVGKSQRRPGLHIERPASLPEKSGRLVHRPNSSNLEEYYKSEYFPLAWGLGCYHEKSIPVDGIYIASNQDNSTRVYPHLVVKPEEVTDAHGGCEHLRDHLGIGEDLKKNNLYWITDRTPHESLPVQPPADHPDAKFVYRQFIRIVVGRISVWYSKHNTPNPFGILPDAPISDSDKFERLTDRQHTVTRQAPGTRLWNFLTSLAFA